MLVLPRVGMHSARCLSVCHMAVFCKHFLKVIARWDSHFILVFPYQTVWQHSNGNPHNGAVNAGGYEKPAVVLQIRREYIL